MKTGIISGKESKQKLFSGIEKISQAASSTMGAKGRNVIIGNLLDYTHITKDGVTVVNSIYLDDEVENIGALMIKEVANKTLEMVGDGTTTSVVLAHEMIKKYFEYSTTEKNNVASIKIGMEKALKKACEEIKKISKIVDSKNDLIKIASISANNDDEIGRLIAEVVSLVGTNGLIDVQMGNTTSTEFESSAGLKINPGYISPYLVTDFDKMICEFVNPQVVVIDKKISSSKDFIDLFENFDFNGDMVIIAHDIEGDALKTLITNHQRGAVKFCGIKVSGVGEQKSHVINDIASYIGIAPIQEEQTSIKPNNIKKVEKAVISKNKTVIYSSNINNELIESKIKELKNIYEKEKDHFIKKRIEMLSAKSATIKVGGATELEIKEKRDRIDDSIRATVASIEEGFVAGGGVTYLNLVNKIKVDCENQDEQIGVEIFKEAICAPFIKILSNGGVDHKTHIDNIIESKYGIGYNIKTNNIEDFLQTGVIDPTKVTRIALENATSVASTFITTECVVYEKR